jgi:hypothetical protein
MKNISDRIVEKTETHILFPVTFIFQKNYSVYEIMWKRVLHPEGPQLKIRCMFIVFCIPTNNMKYLLLFTAKIVERMNVPQC